MKELSIEQKAKAYDEAINIMKHYVVDEYGCSRIKVGDVFPELKESEDERIKEKICKLLWDNAPYEEAQEYIAWLEKQGEQKPTDNRLIPQKGEYYVCIKDYYSADGKTTNTKGQVYKSPCDDYINDNRGFGLSWTNSCIEAYFSPVKDEDWIICENDNVIGEPVKYKTLKSNKVLQKAVKKLEDNGFVIKLRLWTIQDAKAGDVLSDGTTIFIFKDLLSDGSVMSYCDYDTDSGESDAFCPLSVNLMCSKITPAIKEQHYTLMKAMTDAGYTFDFEKKELKELKKIEQNPAWSEEDEINYNYALAACIYYGEVKGYIETETHQKTIDWLKSLRPQNTWKPSDEQMKSLEEVIDAGHYTSYPYALETLYEQLKKLKKE